jgi:hypothetical protein
MRGAATPASLPCERLESRERLVSYSEIELLSLAPRDSFIAFRLLLGKRSIVRLAHQGLDLKYFKLLR